SRSDGSDPHARCRGLVEGFPGEPGARTFRRRPPELAVARANPRSAAEAAGNRATRGVGSDGRPAGGMRVTAAFPDSVMRNELKDATSAHAQPKRADSAAAPFTLGVDIGGTNVKAAVLDRAGKLVANQVRNPTPRPATPVAVLATIAKLASELPAFD